MTSSISVPPGITFPQRTISQVAHEVLYNFDRNLDGVVDKGDEGSGRLRAFLRKHGVTPGKDGFDAAAITDAIRASKLAGGDGKFNFKEWNKLYAQITTPLKLPPIERDATKLVGSIIDGQQLGAGGPHMPGLDVNGDHVLDQHDIDNTPFGAVGPEGPVKVPDEYNPVARLLKHLGVDRITTPKAKEFLAKYAGADGKFNDRELSRMNEFLYGPMRTDGTPPSTSKDG
jgi:hypothetical protein